MIKLTYLLAVVILALPFTLAGGQQPKPGKPAATPSPTPETGEGQVIVTTRRVRLPITVTDRKGQFVPGLTQSDFQVLEDKVPQQIDSFTNRSEERRVGKECRT